MGGFVTPTRQQGEVGNPADTRPAIHAPTAILIRQSADATGVSGTRFSSTMLLYNLYQDALTLIARWV
jgi:hypothetical protein